MLIDGEKWACEACVRGHRVTTCKHHDRPLIRINRKGRPFSTCSVCHRSPCPTPDEHSKLRRESENPNRPPGRASTRPPAAFLPIAPRPASASPPASAAAAAAAAAVVPASRSRRASQAQSHSHGHGHGHGGAGPAYGYAADRRPTLDPALTSAYPAPSVHAHAHAHAHGYPGISARGHTHGGYPAMYPPSTLDPAQLSLGASVGAYAASPVPVSLPMAAGERDLYFGEGGFVDDAALEALDLDEVLREDWSWLDSGSGAGPGHL